MTHIKSAGVIEDALNTVADKMELHKHPFETIFSTMLPAIVWPASKLLSSLFFIADAVGYGPSLIGEYIDEKLGFHSGSPDLSEGNLKQTATSFVDNVFGKLGMQSESDMDIFFQKKSVSMEDLVSIAALVKNKPLVKSAKPGLKNFIGKMFKGQRLSLANVLFFILKKFAFGLIGLGIASGAASYTKKKLLEPQIEVPESDVPFQLKTISPEDKLMSGKLIPYSNVFGNVEESLIEHLKDIKITYEGEKLSLPEYFEKEKSKPLKGSPEMNRLMENKIIPYNKTLNDPVFVAPKLKELGKTILPHMVIANLVSKTKYK